MRKFAQLTNNQSQRSTPSATPSKKNPHKTRQLDRGDLATLKALQDNQISCHYCLLPHEAQLREQLFKWLVAKCRLTLELKISTIEHSMRLFDRYVSKRGAFMVSLDQAQLYLLTCLFISCKYQEIYPPSITDFQYVSKYKFLARDLIVLEPVVLKAVNFELNFPLASDWIYALSAKNSPEWILVCLAHMVPGCCLRKLAEVVVEILGQETYKEPLDDEEMGQYLLGLLQRIN